MYDEFQTDPPNRSALEPANPYPNAPQAPEMMPRPVMPALPPIRPWNNVDFMLVVIAGLISLFLVAPFIEYIFDGFIDQEADPGLQDVIDLTGFTAGYIALFILTVMILAARGLGLRHIGLRDVEPRWIWIALGLGIVFIPIRLMLVFTIAIFVEILSPGTFEPFAAEKGGTLSGWYFLALIEIGLIIVVLAPVVEELIFRGVLHNWLRGRTGRWVAIFISGTLFGLAHLSPMLVISNIVLGLVLSTAYEYSGSLLVPFIIHFTNNFLVAVMMVCLVLLLAMFMV